MSLGNDLLRPRRTKLAEALACARDYMQPDELWEALLTRGLVLPHPDRVFQHRLCCETCGGGGGMCYEDVCDDCAGCPSWHEFHDTPQTVEACVAFASDPVGMVTAEALARETVAALKPWGVAQPNVVAWCYPCPSRRWCDPEKNAYLKSVIDDRGIGGFRHNPFAPLLRIETLGYALESIEADALLLVCPRLDASRAATDYADVDVSP